MAQKKKLSHFLTIYLIILINFPLLNVKYLIKYTQIQVKKYALLKSFLKDHSFKIA